MLSSTSIPLKKTPNTEKCVKTYRCSEWTSPGVRTIEDSNSLIPRFYSVLKMKKEIPFVYFSHSIKNGGLILPLPSCDSMSLPSISNFRRFQRSFTCYRRKHQRIHNHLQSYKVCIVWLKYVPVTMSHKHKKSFKLRRPLSLSDFLLI
jgi:hypothetical protein